MNFSIKHLVTQIFFIGGSFFILKATVACTTEPEVTPAPRAATTKEKSSDITSSNETTGSISGTSGNTSADEEILGDVEVTPASTVLASVDPEPIAPVVPDPIAPVVPDPIAPVVPDPIAPVVPDPIVPVKLTATTASCDVNLGGWCVAQCPAGYTIVGGGGDCYSGKESYSDFLVRTYPVDNGWLAGCSTNTKGNKGYALCIKDENQVALIAPDGSPKSNVNAYGVGFARCPVGYTIAGGGGECANGGGSMKASYPEGNGWMLFCTSNDTNNIAIANCVKDVNQRADFTSQKISCDASNYFCMATCPAGSIIAGGGGNCGNGGGSIMLSYQSMNSWVITCSNAAQGNMGFANCIKP